MEPIKNPNVLRQQEEDLRWLNSEFKSAQKRRWFGKMTIEVKNGMIHLMHNEETLKPPKIDD